MRVFLFKVTGIVLLAFLQMWCGITARVYAQSAGSTRLTVESNVVRINGQPARLVGYGDIGMLAERQFDFRKLFPILQANKINMVRVWANYHWANSLTPYQGSRATKYNIEKLNNAFYQRLVNFVAEADRYGIVVQLCLFDANALETGRDDSRNQRWVKSPLNRANNQNGYLAGRSAYFTTDSQCGTNKDRCIWSKVHAVLIDQVTEKLSGYGNVIYEVMNEPDGSSTGASTDAVVDFHRAVIRKLTDRLRNAAGSRVISINADSAALRELAKNTPEVALYSIHLGGEQGPASADLSSSKPIIISNDGHCTQTIINYTSGNPNRNSACTGAVTNGAADRRAEKTDALLKKIFPDRKQRDGRVHFDFLDKGLNGISWPTTTDYNPRAGNLDRKVLDVLRAFAF